MESQLHNVHWTSSVDKSTTSCWSDATQKTLSIPASFTACYVWNSVVLAFVPAARRTALLLLHPTLQVENMAPMATTLEIRGYQAYNLPKYEKPTTLFSSSSPNFIQISWRHYHQCKPLSKRIKINHLVYFTELGVTLAWPGTKQRVPWQQHDRQSSVQEELDSAHTTRLLQALRAPCHTLGG